MLVMMFPGQGSQYPGMGKELYANHEDVRMLFEQASDLLHRNCADLCFNSTEKELMDTRVTSLAIFLVGYARYKAWEKSFGVLPDLAAGYSVGEITALTVAGMFSFYDAIQIIQKRSQWLFEATEEKRGAMVVVRGLDSCQVDQCLSDASINSVYVSCYNAPQQTVVSGLSYELDKTLPILEEHGESVIPLKRGNAFHTPLMYPADRYLLDLLKGIERNVPSFPVISSVSGMPHLFPWMVAQVLSTQVITPVKWQQTMQKMCEYPIQAVVDMGPGKVVAGLARENTVYAPIYIAETMDERQIIALKKNVSAKNGPGFCADKAFLDVCMLHIVSLRNDTQDHALYIDRVLEPYRYLNWLRDNVLETSLSRNEVLYLLQIVEAILLFKSLTLGPGQFERLLCVTGLSVLDRSEIRQAQPILREAYKDWNTGL